MDPFLAQIKMFAGNFAPRGWSFCDGQILPIAQNTALFSLLGTTYGGDGRTTFALPDMRGRAPLHAGRGPGLSNRVLGQRGGTETETLSLSTMPAHNHAFKTYDSPAESRKGVGKVLGNTGAANAYNTASSQVDLSAESLTSVGGGLSHNNMGPWQGIHHIIAVVGTYPSRA